ncbi:hypothetical protein JIQ42_02651 [Leishmania sp. Namibia]|uniref:hypothetical protein n=1 Tax=Leishmania sp. Namibia TaxID=2802991 RepID=UPI001B452FCB|nr:hypothetical protein JIQ42_02651 [Leishmania sp. Namibia]
MGRLEVRVCGARNLDDAGKLCAPDPYVKLLMGRSNKKQDKFKTKVVRNSTSPVWNEAFKFQVADYNSAQVVFELWNNNVIVDDLMGVYALSVNGFTRGVVSDMWVVLAGTRLSSAELHLQVLAVDFGADPQPGRMVVRSIDEYVNAAHTKPSVAITELKETSSAADFDSVNKSPPCELAMGIPLQSAVGLPAQPLQQPFYGQQLTYVQHPQYSPQQHAPSVTYLQQPIPPSHVVYIQQQPPPLPMYNQQIPRSGFCYGLAPQPQLCIYGPPLM